MVGTFIGLWRAVRAARAAHGAGRRGYRPQRMTAAAQVRPAPKEPKSTLSPGWIRPSCVAGVFDVRDDPVHRHLHRLGDGLDDAHVGLVGDEPVDVGGAEPRVRDRLGGDAGHVADGVLEDRVAVHLQEAPARGERLGRRGEGGAAGLDAEQGGEGAVGPGGGGEDAVLGAALGALDDDRAGAVAEEDAGGAVGPVGDGAHLLGADDQDAARGAGKDVLAGDVQRVEKAGAGGGQVEAGGVREAELVLHEAGGGGKRRVGRDGGQDEQVDLVGGDAGVAERLAGGGDGHVGDVLALAGDAAGADAGAGVDPGVRRVDHPGEVVVGQGAFRKIAAGAGDDRAEIGVAHERAGEGASGEAAPAADAAADAASAARRRSSSARRSEIFCATCWRTHSALTRIAW